MELNWHRQTHMSGGREFLVHAHGANNRVWRIERDYETRKSILYVNHNDGRGNTLTGRSLDWTSDAMQTAQQLEDAAYAN